jgi:myosin-5
MDAAVSALGKGCRVWYRASNTSWQLADIKDKTAAGNYDIIILASGKPEQNIDHTKLAPANPEIQAGIEDLTQLSYLNEPSILHDLWERYQQDSVYTNAGPVLIAVNPCKTLPLYTAEVAQQYKSEWTTPAAGAGSATRCFQQESSGRWFGRVAAGGLVL